MPPLPWRHPGQEWTGPPVSVELAGDTRRPRPARRAPRRALRHRPGLGCAPCGCGRAPVSPPAAHACRTVGLAAGAQAWRSHRGGGGQAPGPWGCHSPTAGNAHDTSCLRQRLLWARGWFYPESSLWTPGRVFAITPVRPVQRRAGRRKLCRRCRTPETTLSAACDTRGRRSGASSPCVERPRPEKSGCSAPLLPAASLFQGPRFPGSRQDE